MSSGLFETKTGSDVFHVTLRYNIPQTIHSFSPVVVNEAVSGLRVWIWVRSGHAAVHVDPQRYVVTPEDRRLNVHHVIQEINAGRPLRLPVL